LNSSHLQSFLSSHTLWLSKNTLLSKNPEPEELLEEEENPEPEELLEEEDPE